MRHCSATDGMRASNQPHNPGRVACLGSLGLGVFADDERVVAREGVRRHAQVGRRRSAAEYARVVELGAVEAIEAAHPVRPFRLWPRSSAAESSRDGCARLHHHQLGFG